jgi:hypothetical protein
MGMTRWERKMINVFFPYYQCGDVNRQLEIDLCLQKNIDNEQIDKLFIMIDDGSEITCNDNKISIVRLEKRPTYKFWLDKTKELGLKGISILCNSDIYFDNSIIEAKKVMCKSQSFIALSRWELLDNETSMHPNPHWSQDVWAVRCDDDYSNEMLHLLEFPMGVPRCDNKIAYLFAIYGWKVFNPCAVLKSIHVHETQMRTYHKKVDDRIIGAVAHVYPSEDPYAEAEMEASIWVKRSKQLKNAKINKTLEKWKREADEEVLSQKNTEMLFNIAQPAALLAAMEHGKIVYKKNIHFCIYETAQAFYFRNIYDCHTLLTAPKTLKSELTALDIVAGLIPPVINTFVDDIKLKALSNEHLNFWQYPCATEKQAYENHLALKPGEHVSESNVVNTYIPLPWATYIDRKDFPYDYLKQVKHLISRYKQLASEQNIELKVHTVCQHIHWVRILDVANDLGITDVHLSHKDSRSEKTQKEQGQSFRLHGWPLIAVNYVVPERNQGMERKALSDKKLLASFIGAHMPHYLDDSRLQLFEAAKASRRDDVFVDLGNEWHFNKVVYEEQVLSKEIESHHIDEHDQKTFRYNTILSDSVFSLCPLGAGPNTLRLWESIAVGTIPVVFSKDLSILTESDLGKEIIDNVIVWDGDIGEHLFEFLHNLKLENLVEKSVSLVSTYQQFETKSCFEPNVKILNQTVEKAEKKTVKIELKNLNVLYVGASVTAQKNGYRPELNKLFEKEGYTVTETVLATGSTGSMFGLCNLSTLPAGNIYDLAIYEYSTGDLNIGLTPQDKIKEIVTNSLTHLCELANDVFVVNNYRADYEHGDGDFIRDLYKQAADIVNVSVLNIYPYFESLKKETNADDWNKIYRDNVHTGVEGSVLLAKELYKNIKLLTNLDYDVRPKLIDIPKLSARFMSLSENIGEVESYTYPSTGQTFEYVSLKENEVLSFKLEGELWGLVSIVGPESAWVEVKVDGRVMQKFAQFDQHCYYTRVQPRQFIRKFDTQVDVEIYLSDEKVDFTQAKEENAKFQSDRLLRVSKLMGKNLRVSNLVQKKRDN